MMVSSTTISSGPEPSLGVPRNLFSSLAAALWQDLRQTVLGGYIFPSAALSGCTSSKHRNSLSLSLCFKVCQSPEGLEEIWWLPVPGGWERK